MTNIRILKHDDLDHYTQLLSSNTHTYSWDKVYLENISNNDLKQMLSMMMNFVILSVLLKMINL